MRIVLILALLASTTFAQTAVYPGAVATDDQLKVAANRVQTKLMANITSADTTIVVQSSTGWAANMLATIGSEVISICGVAGNTLRVGAASGSCPNVNGRGYDSTTAAAHSTGPCTTAVTTGCVSNYQPAWYHNALAAELKATQTALGANLGNVSQAGTFDTARHNFTPQLPGTNLVAGSTTITMAPVPLGINWNNGSNDHYLYVYGGTDAAGVCYIVSTGPGTAVSGAASGSLTLSCAAQHRGAYSIASANGGFSEAHARVAAGQSIIITADITAYSPLRVTKNNLEIRGVGVPKITLANGVSTVPLPTEASVVQFISVTGGSISNVEIDGNEANNAGNGAAGNSGVILNPASNVTVGPNIYSHDNLASGFRILGASTGNKIYGNRTSGNGGVFYGGGSGVAGNVIGPGNISDGDGHTSYQFVDAGVNTVQGNVVRNGVGWAAGSACILFDSKQVIQDNVLDHCAGRGIASFYAPDTVIHNNTIIEAGANVTAGNGAASGAGVESNFSSRSKITENKIITPVGPGVLLNSSQDTTVSGNVITDPDAYCRSYGAANYCDGIFVGWETDFDYYVSGTNNNVFDGNVVTNAYRHGIAEDDFDSPVHQERFLNNIYTSNVVSGSGSADFRLATPNVSAITACNGPSLAWSSTSYDYRGCQIAYPLLTGLTLINGPAEVNDFPQSSLRVGAAGYAGKGNTTLSYNDTKNLTVLDVATPDVGLGLLDLNPTSGLLSIPGKVQRTSGVEGGCNSYTDWIVDAGIPITAATATLYSGTYTSGITFSGTNLVNTTCLLKAFQGVSFRGVATVALTGTNTITGGTALVVKDIGSGFTANTTTATVESITAKCIGTATVSIVNRAKLTSTAHGMVTGDRVIISGATGSWTPINGSFSVTRIDADTFTIPVDSTTFGALTGTVVMAPRKVYSAALYTTVSADWGGKFSVTAGAGATTGDYRITFENHTSGTGYFLLDKPIAAAGVTGITANINVGRSVYKEGTSATDRICLQSGSTFGWTSRVTPSILNYIATETGGANAIAGALTNATGAPVVATAGLCLTIKLAHGLQVGANTFALSGGAAASIKSSRNPANDIGVAYVSGGLFQACYDGAAWQDTSQ